VIRALLLVVCWATVALSQQPSRKVVKRAARTTLFGDSTPLVLSLQFDHRAVFADRDTLSQRRYDGRVIVEQDGETDTIPVRLRPRGHYRLGVDHCDFVPLLLEFRDRPSRGSPFDGQSALKLVTHCASDSPMYEEYVLREQLVYRMHGLLTAESFRTRLVAASYSDSSDSRWRLSRRALLIEDEDAVAKRAGGKIRTQRGALWANLDSAAVMSYALFQYFIGGTDWSLTSLHNVRIVQRDDMSYLPLAYDFDWTGMVQAVYARPDPRLRVSRTRDRLFRGPCWSVESYAPAVQQFVALEQALLGLLEVPGLSAEYRTSTKAWIGEFYATVRDPVALAKVIKRGCGVST
jgi:hypothetical protein